MNNYNDPQQSQHQQFMMNQQYGQFDQNQMQQQPGGMHPNMQMRKPRIMILIYLCIFRTSPTENANGASTAKLSSTNPVMF
jgi:hypothetical protein